MYIYKVSNIWILKFYAQIEAQFLFGNFISPDYKWSAKDIYPFHELVAQPYPKLLQGNP